MDLIQDITAALPADDPNAGDIRNATVTISVAGGLQLEMTLTDRGEPGSTGVALDSIGFTVWKGEELWYSSNWDGTQTLEELLDGGNVQVHTLNGSRN